MALTNTGSRQIQHPQYVLWAATWRKLLDLYEGSGGFLDEDRPYLIPHPREWQDHSIQSTGSDGTLGWAPNPNPTLPSPKLVMRRKLARYENLAATILDAILASLFHEPATRMAGDPGSETVLPIQDWWQDVDGLGTDIDAFMQRAWTQAGTFGHVFLLVEKAKADAETAADQALPTVCTYSPLDVIDWLVDEYGRLIAVKFLEAAPRTDFTRVKPDDVRVRVVDAEQWTLYDKSGKKIEGAVHGFGRIPVVVLYGKRRPMLPVVGKSVIGDPALFIDIYNLASEERELLRNQTFAILNVPVGEGGVEAEQAKLGQQSGTANVMFSTEPAQFISPSGDNVTAYQNHSERLARMIYRLASVPWDGDSRDAESADSRRLKRQEMVATLSKFADELHTAEMGLVELIYRALHGDQWETQMEADQVSIAYPDTFEPPDLELVAANASAAMGLDLGETATKALKKQTARVFLPSIDAKTLAAIDKEIDAQTILTADEKRQQMLDDAAARMAQGGMTPDGRDNPPAA